MFIRHTKEMDMAFPKRDGHGLEVWLMVDASLKKASGPSSP